MVWVGGLRLRSGNGRGLGSGLSRRAGCCGRSVVIVDVEVTGPGALLTTTLVTTMSCRVVTVEVLWLAVEVVVTVYVVVTVCWLADRVVDMPTPSVASTMTSTTRTGTAAMPGDR